MPPPCNKCRQGWAQEGDSWCLGCSSLELSQGLLRQGWRHQGLRAIAEETVLSSARLVRAFANLDQSLGQSGAALTSRAPAVTSKARASRPARSRSPRRNSRPPLPRSPRRELKAEPRSERDSDSDFEEDEDDEEEDDRPEKEVSRERRGGSDRPPEPEGPPPGRRESAPPPAPVEHERTDQGEKKQKRRRRTSGDHQKRGRRRGGARHQKRYKDLQNPFRRSHRKLRSDLLEFAWSFEEGLARRY